MFVANQANPHFAKNEEKSDWRSLFLCRVIPHDGVKNNKRLLVKGEASLPVRLLLFCCLPSQRYCLLLSTHWKRTVSCTSGSHGNMSLTCWSLVLMQTFLLLQILEITLLMASYINAIIRQKGITCNVNETGPASKQGMEVKVWDLESAEWPIVPGSTVGLLWRHWKLHF